MDKQYGVKQTDYRLSPEFNKWGCNVRSVIRMVEEWEDYELSWRDIRDVVQEAIMEGYVTADMSVKNYIGLSRCAFRAAGNDTAYIRDIGTMRENGPPTFYGWAEKAGEKDWNFTIGRWKTDNGNDHYVFQDAAGGLLFDPYPEDTRDEFIYDILFQVVD